MLKKISPVFILLFAAFVWTSCDKDPRQIGCTDPEAVNYDPSAIRSDDSCIYNDDEQMIWRNGMRGGWNNDLQEGAFRLEVCMGEVYERSNEEESDTTEVDPEGNGKDSGLDDTDPDDTDAEDTDPVDSDGEDGDSETEDTETTTTEAVPTTTLYFGTGNDEVHKSYFSLINERNGRDFAEGRLRMGIRTVGDDTPEYIQLYINGKIIDESECNPHRRSDFVEISTHSFNDSTFTEVNIPIRNFDKIQMAHVEVACGIRFVGPRGSGFEVNEIRWVANKQRD